MSKKKKKYLTPLGYQLELIKKELPDEYEKLMELVRTTKQQKVMSKEQQELLDEAYENYKNKTEIMMGHGFHGTLLSKEEFIDKCKTDTEFSERWGLKIEEQELNTDERNKWFQINLNGNNPLMKSDWKDYELDQQNIPSKLITITYNDKTIESYE